MTIPCSGIKNNKDRRKFWETLSADNQSARLQQAMSAIDPTCAKVLHWYYTEQKSFPEITVLLNRSISIVRNHHNRGIFLLQQYFIKLEA